VAGRFPELMALLADAPTLQAEVEAYARALGQSSGLQREAQLRALFEQRSRLMPGLESRLIHAELDPSSDQIANLEAELNRLGLTLLMAEGMVIGLGPAPVAEAAVARLGAPAYQAYLDFQYADAASQQGEYPYLDLKPYERMVLAGERLIEERPTPYWQAVEDRFYQALTAITDLHLMKSTGAREGQGTPMVGGVSTEMYPYAAEIESLRSFAERHPHSRFARAVEQIVAHPSTISERPQALYVVILEWVDEAQAAQRRVARYLSQGEDIPHHLPVQRGDGRTQYAIAYRFFEDADQAEEALTRIQQTHPEAEMIFCSVKGEQLYQLGPGR